MAYTAHSEVDEFSAYHNSFGNIPHGTVISDPLGMKGFETDYATNMKGFIDKNPCVAKLKALQSGTGGSGSTDKVLIPVYLDPKMVDVSRRQTPLVTMIPRVTNMGIIAAYNRITAKGGAFTAIEDATLTETNTTYERASEPIKYLYSVGRVTGPGLAAIPGFDLAGFQTTGGAGVGADPFNNAYASNAMQQEILIKMRELKELEENLIVNGDKSGTPTEYDGIVNLQSTTNEVDAASGPLTLGMIDQAIQKAYDAGGYPNVAICDTSTYTDLLGLLNNKVGYMNSQVETQWGFTAIRLNTMVGQLIVVPSRFLTATTTNKSMYFLDLRYIEMRVLLDATYERFGKFNDSDKFMIKCYECMIMRAPEFNAKIKDIK